MSHHRLPYRQLVWASALMLSLSACSADGPTAPRQPSGCVPGALVAGQLIVSFQPDVSEEEARRFIQSYALQVLQVGIGFAEDWDHRWMLVGVPAGSESFWIGELGRSELVLIVEQNSTVCIA